MSGDGKDITFYHRCNTWVVPSQYRRNLAIIIRGIEWINLDLTIVIIIATDQRDTTAFYGTVI